MRNLIAISKDSLHPNTYRVKINQGGNMWYNPYSGTKENAMIIKRAFLKVGFKDLKDKKIKKFLNAI